MWDELRAFEAAQRAAATGSEAPGSADSRLKRRAERAEESFERALAAAGGASGTRADPEAAAKVAELEALQKEAAIADRLSALRGGGKPAPAKKRASAKPAR
jgi:hypothetical protein